MLFFFFFSLLIAFLVQNRDKCFSRLINQAKLEDLIEGQCRKCECYNFSCSMCVSLGEGVNFFEDDVSCAKMIKVEVKDGHMCWGVELNIF